MAAVTLNATAGAYRPLLVAALLLTFTVVGFGAYVRLTDAGLGCPDWPGCYGHLVGIPDAAHEHAAAAAAFPGRPVDAGKAWREMIHRYLAGSLGLVVVALAAAAWRRRAGRPPPAETALLGLIALQAALGMWTVTLLLKPLIVTLHLLGGMATWALLVTLAAREFAPAPAVAAPRRLAILAVAAVVVQIGLGGWVSSNYAGLACAGFPACGGQWLPALDFGHGFSLVRNLGETAAGEPLPAAALTTIQWTHRLGALAVALIVGGLAATLLADHRRRGLGFVLLVALLAQLGVGVANVVWQLPLPLAVAHNLGAALLLALTLLARRLP